MRSIAAAPQAFRSKQERLDQRTLLTSRTGLRDVRFIRFSPRRNMPSSPVLHLALGEMPCRIILSAPIRKNENPSIDFHVVDLSRCRGPRRIKMGTEHHRIAPLGW